MILLPYHVRRVQAAAGTAGAAPVATITHNKNGTFSIIFRGTNGSVIYCDPGDGSAVQEKTLLGTSTDVTFSYVNNGSILDVKISGSVNNVSSLTSSIQNLRGDIGEFAVFKNIETLNLSYNYLLNGDLSSLLSTFSSIKSLTILGSSPSLDVSIATWVSAGITSLTLTSLFSTSERVGNVLINSAGVQTSGVITLTGTSPAPPSTPEVTAAIAQLSMDGVSLLLN